MCFQIEVRQLVPHGKLVPQIKLITIGTAKKRRSHLLKRDYRDNIIFSRLLVILESWRYMAKHLIGLRGSYCEDPIRLGLRQGAAIRK